MESMLFINIPILENIIHSPTICGFLEYLYSPFVMGLFKGVLQNVINADTSTVEPTENKIIPTAIKYILSVKELKIINTILKSAKSLLITV